MKILYYLPYPKGLGADYWIYEGWKYAFKDLGHQFFKVTEYDNLRDKVIEVNPDIFFVANLGKIVIQHKECLKWIRNHGTKIFLIVYWPLRKKEVEIIKNEEVADVYFGEREPESMKEFEEQTGRKYYLIPQAANKRWHFPTKPVEKYQYDILFIGAYLPKKKKMFKEILLPLTKKYKVGIFGPYWTLKDNTLRAIQKFCRTIKFKGGADFINEIRFRTVIPSPKEQNKLYSSSKICLNFHEREADGSQPHYILTQRTFLIPACGGFEICDYVPALRKYFDEDEVVMAKDKDDWFKKIEYYLSHEEERKKIQEKGTKRALKDHTYHNRVKQVIDLAKRLGC